MDWDGLSCLWYQILMTRPAIFSPLTSEYHMFQMFFVPSCMQDSYFRPASILLYISPNTIITVSFSGPSLCWYCWDYWDFYIRTSPNDLRFMRPPNCIGQHACLGCSWTSFELWRKKEIKKRNTQKNNLKRFLNLTRTLPFQTPSGFVSGSELLEPSSCSALRTFQENLDALLGGPGIPLGTITGENF